LAAADRAWLAERAGHTRELLQDRLRALEAGERTERLVPQVGMAIRTLAQEVRLRAVGISPPPPRPNGCRSVDLTLRVRPTQHEGCHMFFSGQRHLFVLLAGLGLVVWLPTHAAAEPGLTAQDYYNQGEVYLGKKKYDLAIAYFAEAIALDKQMARAYLGRAVAYHA